ncbi:uncharacterized protein LOC119093013 isoform X3 [Pollicipes pollicipes]|nr:uncharacterized protein LOC119093013 isoform X3 [Pollicipes pollicipes]
MHAAKHQSSQAAAGPRRHQNAPGTRQSRPNVAANQQRRTNAPVYQRSRQAAVANRRQQPERRSHGRRVGAPVRYAKTARPTKKQNIAPKLPRTQEVVHSVYPQAYESHEGVNARNMTLFLFRRSDRPSHYVDRTSGTGTLYTSRRGACPAMPLSGCSPLPRGGLPRSCANDYQCGDHLKCCYDPCLTINKCVRPVAG